jgi:outer membrane immunogenic protein
MKHTILGGLAISALLIAAPLSTAKAADMPLKAPPPPPAPVSSWTGFYIGANVGAAWGDPNQSFSQANTAPFDPVEYAPVNLSHGNTASLAGGVHGGYNWQVAPTFLLGVEGDFSALKLHDAPPSVQLFTNTTGTPVFNNFLTMSDSTTWLSSVRGRVGFIATNNFLIYATGGAAWARVGSTGFPRNPAGANINSILTSTTNTLSGWVVGGGVEYLMAQHWMLRVEYLNYGLPSRTATAACTACGVGSFDGNGVFTWNRFNIGEIRTGLSYKF